MKQRGQNPSSRFESCLSHGGELGNRPRERLLDGTFRGPHRASSTTYWPPLLRCSAKGRAFLETGKCSESSITRKSWTQLWVNVKFRVLRWGPSGASSTPFQQ